MKVLRVGILATFVFCSIVASALVAQATPAGDVVISQVQAGNASSSRLIEIYNNSGNSVDVTDWCVRYVTATTNTPRACFVTPDIAQRLVLPAWSYVLIGSSQLGVIADYSMSEGLGTGTAGSVYLVDASGKPRDIFGWGNTTHAEGTPKPSDSTNRVYERRQIAAGIYVDENNNATDFSNSSLRGGDREPYKVKALLEAVDTCVNIDGIQDVIPDGLIAEKPYYCVAPPIDLCVNIEGLQVTLPANTEVDNEGNCYLDTCANLPGFQTQTPDGYVHDELGVCLLGLLPVQVTEMLPNPEGDDSGNEFIEFYNPNDEIIDMSYHVFYLNEDYSKAYSIVSGTKIGAKSYLVIKNGDASPAYTLTNSSGSLHLRAPASSQEVTVPMYSNAASGESWALVQGVWQYTPIPSPGAVNVIPEAGQGSVGAAATDCGEGRERNPATNRCRNIPSASVLAPCKDGQYRSEETNRCRSIATAASALKQCADNQFRNPLTNRCRNIASSEDLADCGEGRERNPETNRCRNVLGVTKVPESTFKVDTIKDSPMTFVGWWALGIVATLAVSYAAWEWRREITDGYRNVVSRFSGKR